MKLFLAYEVSRFSLRELVYDQFQNVFYSHRIIFIEIICIKNEWTRFRNIMDRVTNPLPRLPYCSTLWRTMRGKFLHKVEKYYKRLKNIVNTVYIVQPYGKLF